MAHKEQQDFCNYVQEKFPNHFIGSYVLDIGSLDINGNNRYLFHNSKYIGIDVSEGRNVDAVCMGHRYTIGENMEYEKFDTIISTECFEHDKYWALTIQNVCNNLLRDSGLFLFTCATTGRPEHGTRRSDTGSSPLTSNIENWDNYYLNLTEMDIRQAVDIDAIFDTYEFIVNGFDLYFWGIKK
jgi:hypothetical protein